MLIRPCAWACAACPAVRPCRASWPNAVRCADQGQLPRLTAKQILAWADAHHRRTGTWPTSSSGPVHEVAGETWRAVDQAFRVATRGLPGRSSLGAVPRPGAGRPQSPAPAPPNGQANPDLGRRPPARRTGAWPTSKSAHCRERRAKPGAAFTWRFVRPPRFAGRLDAGPLPGTAPGRPQRQTPAPLHRRAILRSARAHRRRTGHWPTRNSGPITEAPGETWSAVNAALTSGCRGLPAGWTLAGLLAAPQPVPPDSTRRRFTVRHILAWADAYHTRTGAWPDARSGPIAERPGETWRNVDQALAHRPTRFGPGRHASPFPRAHRPVRRPAPLAALDRETNSDLGRRAPPPHRRLARRAGLRPD